jgi:hypothetical protein
MTYGFTEDASKPAPMMKELLRRLATPDPYNGSTNPEYRAAVDRINEVFAEARAEQLTKVERLEPRDGRDRIAA